MKTKIIPLGERVLVKPFTEQDLKKSANAKSKLNFILPESVTKEKSAQGKVMAVGESNLPAGRQGKLKVGDIILFSKYAYDEVEQNGEELYLIKEENVLAVIK